MQMQPDDEREHALQGNHSGRRIWHSTLSHNARHRKELAAGLQQAHDLLSPLYAHAGGRPRDPGYFDPRRCAEIPSAAGGWEPVRHSFAISGAAKTGRDCTGIFAGGFGYRWQQMRTNLWG